MNELVEVIEKSAVEKPTAEMLQNSFSPLFEKAQAWAKEASEIIVTDSDQKELMLKAREIRLSLKTIRIEADKKRKELKEDSLRYGKAVQGVYNVIEFLIMPIEKHLENQEKFAERQEEQKRLIIKEEREKECQPYSEFIPLGFDLGMITEEDYQKFLTGFKLQLKLKEEAIQKEEAEKLEAERKRLEEQERIKAENEKLKAEREAREKEIAIEKAAAEKKAKAEAAEREKELEKEKAIAQAEREAREKAEFDMEKLAKEKEAIEEERKAREKAEIEKQRKAQNAPDREKIVKFISDLSLIAYPDVKQDDAKKIIEFARIEIGKLSAQLSNKISQI